MRTFTSDELKKILDKHSKWLRNEYGGSRADLSSTNLSRADLPGANLSGANLSGADLSSTNLFRADLPRADLSSTNLSRADLSRANLFRADLPGANLSGANLSGADLSSTNLFRANLSRANLSGANLPRADLSGAEIEIELLNKIIPICCPEYGAFIGWKKCKGNTIVKLEICEDAKRSSAYGRKCRCSAAKVLAIENVDGTPSALYSVASGRDEGFIYRVGETVSVPDFDEDRRNECSTGIHFFITRQEAVDYEI